MWQREGLGNSILRNERVVLGIIFAFAFLLRILAVFYLKSYIFSSENEHWAYGWEMGRIARYIASGKGFSFTFNFPWSTGTALTAWHPPVYPYFIALFFKTFGIYSKGASLAIEILQSFFSAFTSVFLYGIGKRIFNYRVGIISAIIFSFYPPSIFFAIKRIWETSLFALLISIIMWNTIRIKERVSLRESASQGFLMGFAALVIPVIISLYPFALYWLFRNSKGSIEERTKGVMAIVIVCFFVVLPWTIRNYVRPCENSNKNQFI